MKPGSWLINVARGRLVDERALLRALRDGHLGGAILDTFRDEPLQPSSPFYDLPNVIVTPHTSWSSARVLDRSVELFCDNLRRFARRRAAAERGRSDPGLTRTLSGCRPQRLSTALAVRSVAWPEWWAESADPSAIVGLAARARRPSSTR